MYIYIYNLIYSRTTYLHSNLSLHLRFVSPCPAGKPDRKFYDVYLLDRKKCPLKLSIDAFFYKALPKKNVLT